MYTGFLKNRQKQLGSFFKGRGSLLWSMNMSHRAMSTTPMPQKLIDGGSHDFTKEKYDAVIIGGGHNGLVCSNYLAMKNKKVLVLERRDIVGGAAASEELVPGYKFSRFSYVLSLLRKVVIDEIFPKNWKDELKLYKRNPSSFTPTKEKNKYLLLGSDEEFNHKEIAKFSKNDAKNMVPYEAKLNEIVSMISPFIDSEPSLKLSNLAKTYFTARRSMKSSVPELYQMLTAPASVILDQYFESDILKGTLASDAVIGANQSPYSANSSYVLIHHVMGEVLEKGIWAYVEGGMGTLSNYIAHLAEQRGVKIAVNSEVDRILVKPESNQVTGVKLTNGQTIECKTVITNCTNSVVYNQLIEDTNVLPEDFRRGIKNVSYEGVQVKFNMILNDVPKFTCLDHIWNDSDSFSEKVSKFRHYMQGTIHINSESMQQIHEAYADCFNGNFSKRPMVELVIPSMLDPTLVPADSERLVANMFVQYAPNTLSGGRKWDDDNKNKFIQNTFDVIDEYAPNFSKSVEFKDVLFPPDLEKIINMTGGNIFHGALDFNNVFFSRPMPNYANYEWPVKGLWSCGSSNHPGGGVMGAPGRNCALRLLSKGL